MYRRKKHILLVIGMFSQEGKFLEAEEFVIQDGKAWPISCHGGE